MLMNIYNYFLKQTTEQKPLIKSMVNCYTFYCTKHANRIDFINLSEDQTKF
jgi:hypothetical protein